jgi:hypothetical protein
MSLCRLSSQIDQRRRILRALMVGLLILATSSKAININDGALWRPRFVTPSIVALDNVTNRQFVAEVKASPSADQWSAVIANDLKAWPCDVTSAAYAMINRGTEPGWQISLSIPPDVSPELFALTVSCNESVSTQPQAVSVVPAFATNFYILHLTDEHVGNRLHTDSSGQYFEGVGTWEEIKWMQEPINLINPRFAMVTGDQIDFNGALDGWNNWSNWSYKPAGKRVFTKQETIDLENRLSALYTDCHAGYHVAYMETPGNHDVTPPGKRLYGSAIDWHPISVQVYETLFGQRSYSFRMGDFYVLMHDWSDSALRDWAAKDLESSFEGTDIKYRLIGQHYHTVWDGAPTGNYALRTTNCDLMLIGHGHSVATIQSSPHYIYEDGPTFRNGRTGFFNFRKQTNGWVCDQTVSARNYTNDVWSLFTAHGVAKKVRTDQPDAMNVTTNCVTIVNDLPQNFYDGRVRFVLKRGKYDQVNGGTILAEYDSTDTTKTVVLVKVNIPASGSIRVQLTKNNGNTVE